MFVKRNKRWLVPSEIKIDAELLCLGKRIAQEQQQKRRKVDFFRIIVAFCGDDPNLKLKG